MMTNHGVTLQGAAKDVLLRRWCVYAQKHKRWRKVTPGALVRSILATGGHFDYFPSSPVCLEVYLPIEHEYLRHGVEHCHKKIKAQVQREGREFDLIFPTPPKLEALKRPVSRPVKLCPACLQFTMSRSVDGEWSCDSCQIWQQLFPQRCKHEHC